MNKERLVLNGNGIAEVRTLEELLKVAPNKNEITVFGAAPYGLQSHFTVADIGQ